MVFISILIVNYNTKDIIRKCIDSIYNFEKKIIFEIIIIDNNSSDISKEVINELARKYKEVKTVFLNEKKSFSYANNRGYEISKGDYILMMNSDVFLSQKILEKLVRHFDENDRLGGVSPLLFGMDGIFQRRYFQRYPTLLQFIFFYSIFAKFFSKYPLLANKYLENRDLNINSKELEYTNQIPGAFFLTKKVIYREAGQMDERYDLFFEDVDFSYQINKRYKLAVDTSVKIHHIGGASFKMSDDYWLYGRFILSMINFFQKNYGSFKALCLKYMTVINSYIVLLIERIKMVFGNSSDYRIRKHEYFLSEFKKKYF